MTRETGEEMAAGQIQADMQERGGDGRSVLAERGGDGAVPTQGTASSQAQGVPLLGQSDVSQLNGRWGEVQTRFVDEPRESVRQADQLVAEVIDKLSSRFADERGRLEQRWQSGGEASTEDLRQALQLYRSFFQRLLAA